jgi:hypothetical protein
MNENPDSNVVPLSFEEFCRRKELAEDSFDSSDPDLYEPVEPVLWDVLSKKPSQEHPWRIKHIIPEEGFMILASVSGEKKTWVAMEMARCLVMGTDFLGEERFKTRGCNVLYINCENPESEIQRRGKQLGFPDSSPHKLYFLNDAGGMNFNDEKVVKWFLSLIEYYQVETVFVDTFRAVAGSLREEKAEEVRQFFTRLGSLKDKGVAIVWLDHFRKPSNLDGKIPKKEHLLGSQDKTASVETLLMIKSENGSETIDCYQRKNRLAIELKPFQIVMADHVDETGNTKTLLTYGGEIDDQETKKEAAKELIFGLLEKESRSSKEILELLKKEAGGRNIRDALREMVESKLIDVAKRGRENLYFLPEEVKIASNSLVNTNDDLFVDTK